MSSYTPGPYLFEKQHRGKYLVLAERPNKCPIEVAECFSEPNARLFAAAPEMYEKLNEIMEKLDNLSFNLPDEESGECAADLRDEISHFLRKIMSKEEPPNGTGEQNLK